MATKDWVRNAGMELDLAWVESARVNMPAANRRAATHKTRRSVKKEWQAAWLLRAVQCIDLTTLDGDDTPGNVKRLCFKAQTPVRQDLIEQLGMEHKNITCGAVCVYSSRVEDAVRSLKEAGSTVPIASVAAGFPAGQTPMEQRLAEIRQAVAFGASEIDIVITRTHVLTGNWQALYDEVKAMREACGDAHLKTILATGQLGTLTNVYKASVVSMMAGSDVIKTSTGKEGVNATFPVALVMLRAIREYFQRTGYRVGFKPAGGIRSAKDALSWLALMKEELGDEWTRPELFRIGASSLLGDIERQLFHHCTGRYAAAYQMPMS
ncbi:deoxyribose-phosphate aldolase-like [Sycon ciliatum]|uniref:deoxyribose-phosphate aldolase-like n=1 Tax=Sycon ciliatum TaxID=27933 RepID=UPI0020ABBA77|eukprot:scpid27965/ scgid31849/ Putative deoxyribose-phosphate aldolase; 2-deoxy-D-ribose 5-phosphate aldolase; Phosphodeoxyriboaldolase